MPRQVACLTTLCLLACAAARPPPPEVPSSPAPLVFAPATTPAPHCSAFDHGVRIEAYWHSIPWKAKDPWIRIDGTVNLYLPEPTTPLSVRGCREQSTSDYYGPGIWQPGPEPFDLGCVPAASEIELSVEYPCRFGTGRRQVSARIGVVPGLKPGERLPVTYTALPPTPTAEQNGGEELAVWRSRAEVPDWLRPHVPGDLDFDHFMLVGPDVPPGGTAGLVVLDPAELQRIEHVLVVHFHYPPPVCECRGVAEEHPEPIRAEPLRLWRLPKQDGKAFLREHFTTCPPCFAP